MAVSPKQGNITASPLALPFLQDTLDLIVLPHTLDLSHDPHQVLREAQRVLIPEGHIVLIAFNPMSMMGLCKLALMGSKRIPWASHFYTARRLKDWLALLDFTVLTTAHPPVRPCGSSTEGSAAGVLPGLASEPGADPSPRAGVVAS